MQCYGRGGGWLLSRWLPAPFFFLQEKGRGFALQDQADPQVWVQSQWAHKLLRGRTTQAPHILISRKHHSPPQGGEQKVWHWGSQGDSARPVPPWLDRGCPSASLLPACPKGSQTLHSIPAALPKPFQHHAALSSLCQQRSEEAEGDAHRAHFSTSALLGADSDSSKCHIPVSKASWWLEKSRRHPGAAAGTAAGARGSMPHQRGLVTISSNHNKL